MSLIPSPVRRGVEALLAPIVDRLIALDISPNAITTVGTGLLVLAGVAFGAGWIRTGGALLLASGGFDMLDGRVARGAGGTTKFGAFYDSTLDRVGEWVLFTGILVYFVTGGVPPEWRIPGVVLAVSALACGLIVSYARARAEGLGLECKVGIAQRAERIVGIGAPSLLFGAGPDGMLLFIIVGVLAAIALITVFQRIAHVYHATRATPRTTQARRVPTDFAPYLGKGPNGE
ncbi:MAG TPA: CDP-alcohol phosphatidyltransferase family protein [Gemmatimonadales bacterium]|nr:CDP-alcohol phosphatidyltransferase family protein [Gemmatimonadales bacterium]